MAGADSKVFVGVGVSLASLLEQKPLCLLVQFPQYFLVLVQEPLCCWVQIPCTLVLMQEPLCMLVQIPWYLLVLVQVALVFSGADSMYTGADSMVFVGA